MFPGYASLALPFTMIPYYYLLLRIHINHFYVKAISKPFYS